MVRVRVRVYRVRVRVYSLNERIAVVFLIYVTYFPTNDKVWRSPLFNA